MFQNNPELAVDLLDNFEIPMYDAVVTKPGELAECPPTEYRADAVVLLSHKGKSVMAVVVENQLGEDKEKRFSWPVYLTTVHAKYRCRTELLVLCPDEVTARWARKPIEISQSGTTIFPTVVGPSLVRRMTDPQEMLANLELAALSVISHGGRHDGGNKILQSWLEIIPQVPDDRSQLYFDYVMMQLSDDDRKHMETLMSMTGTYEYQSDFARKYIGLGKAEGKVEGKVEGEAEALLTVLEARGLAISDQARDRISTCTNLDQLNTWLTRAITITTTDELFD